MKLPRRYKKLRVDDIWQTIAFVLIVSFTLFAFMGSLVVAVFRVKR